jgi:hypothetical protein
MRLIGAPMVQATPAIAHRSFSIDPLIFITAILSVFILSMLAMIAFTLIFRSRRGGAG